MPKDLSSSVVFLFFGLIFLFFFFYKRRQRQRLMKGGIQTKGTVIEFQRGKGKDASNVYPLIGFVTKDHKKITVLSSTSYPTFIMKKGSEVNLFYNAENPEDFILDVKADRWLMVVLLIAAFLFLLWTFLSLTTEFHNK